MSIFLIPILILMMCLQCMTKWSILSLCLLQSLHFLYLKFLFLDLTLRFLCRIPISHVFSSMGLVNGVPIVLKVLTRSILELGGRYCFHLWTQFGSLVLASV